MPIMTRASFLHESFNYVLDNYVPFLSRLLYLRVTFFEILKLNLISLVIMLTLFFQMNINGKI